MTDDLLTEEALNKRAEELYREEIVQLLRNDISKRVHIVGFSDRDPKWIFVPDTYNRGRYCRVPYWFAFTTCEHCGALEGQPCVSQKHGRTYSGVDSAHVKRRYQARNKEKAILREFAKRGPPEDIIDPLPDWDELWKDVVEGNSS